MSIVSKLKWSGPTIISRLVTSGGGEGLGAAAEYLLQVSNESAPIEEGTMIRSGGTDVDEEAGEASVFYDVPYAPIQHESVGFNHDVGRRAKWLELTMKEKRQQLLELIAEGMRGS